MDDVLLHDKLKEAAHRRNEAFARHDIDLLHLAYLSREHRRLTQTTQQVSGTDMKHFRAVLNKIEQEEPRLRAALSDLFAGPLGAVEVYGLYAVSEAQRGEVQKAAAYLSTITSMQIAVNVAAPPGRIREAYDPHSRTLLLSYAGTPAPVIVHELGHALEDQAASPHLIGLRQAFYTKRTAGQQPVPLAAVTGNGAYHPSEHTMTDRWLHPYIGKLYTDVRASEVVSMGLQLLYDDPVLLADDLEHLDFLYVFLRGAHE